MRRLRSFAVAGLALASLALATAAANRAYAQSGPGYHCNLHSPPCKGMQNCKVVTGPGQDTFCQPPGGEGQCIYMGFGNCTYGTPFTNCGPQADCYTGMTIPNVPPCTGNYTPCSG